MFALVAKETHLAHTLLQYVKLQRAYHESALHSLADTVPELERVISKLLSNFNNALIVNVYLRIITIKCFLYLMPHKYFLLFFYTN